MVSNYDVIQYLEKNAENDKIRIYYDRESKFCREKDTNDEFCTVDEFTMFLRKKLHCDFECILHEHASLTTIYRCKECGAIIFTGDDERYDPNLCCPNCSDYPHDDFWTKEEIEADEEKQKELNGLLEYARIMRESDERREKRGGLYDWQLAKKNFYTKKHSYHFELNIDSIIRSKVKGLELKVDIGDKDEDGMGYIVKKFFTIPLSATSFYRHCIYPYKNECPEELRKYYFWQKKPQKLAS